ncbi:mannosyl-oligosaccharide alpha-1,2-mannosidase [Kickxella alabastrina]|uniref:Mannosyl-oligosaccharide alpha-1,2-mannosidase n=1 Tax=Kickxella alabastrina TaxID=61397 RepID=A0ACC1IPE7_9FUNG|nr:mannosyl-oligosaccharide alpha-1,2-mannosidase [Kickxella alabastrina]
MFSLSLRRLLGTRNKRILLFLLLLASLAFIYHSHSRNNSETFENETAAPPPNPWLKFADHLPTEEYDALLTARASRPSPWTSLTMPNWQATEAQQLSLNRIIRNALQHPEATQEIWQARQDRVVDATKYAWDAYRRNAFGCDEYHPISRTGTNNTRQGVGYFVADVLDTLLLMGLVKEYNEGRNFLVHHVSYDQPGVVSLFETTIRVLGGLLAAFHWSGESDHGLLDLATDLGLRLAKSMNTSTGIPPETAILRSDGMPYASLSSTAEVATLQLEFRYLSKLTHHTEFRTAVDRIMDVLLQASKYDGLVPIYVNAQTGQFAGDDIRLGSRGDSYYEYLLKQWMQTGQTEPRYREEYDRAMDGVKKFLVEVTPMQNLTYIGELTGLLSGAPAFKPKMDHLVCFLGGNLALGATKGKPLSQVSPLDISARDREDLILARELTETCVRMYLDMPLGLSPEIAHFRQSPASPDDPNQGDILVHQADRHNILRPETIESLLLLWRITGEEKWREYGWVIFENFEKWAKMDNGGGFTGLRDVTEVPPKREDKMETFFLAETLKYFYLLFGSDEKVPLTKYVFNTEAHPLPMFSWE